MERRRERREQEIEAARLLREVGDQGHVKVTAKRIYLNQSPWLKRFLNGTKITLTFFEAFERVAIANN